MTPAQKKYIITALLGVIATLSTIVAMLQGPESLPALPFAEIKSDDGTATAWLIDAGGTYTLDRDLEATESAVFVTSATDVTLDLAGHEIAFGSSGKIGCVGINPRKSISKHAGFGENDKRFSAALPDGSWRSRTLTIRNGTIRHTGPPESRYACCVGGDYTFPVVLQNVTLESSGPDAACVNCDALMMTNCRAVCRTSATSNRHQTPANVRAKHIVATDNTLIGGNSGFAVLAGTASITGNVIRNHAFATNGYGVMCYRCEAVTIADNLIVPTNGRGVLDNGPPDFVDRKPVVVRDNVIIVRETPNSEYGDGLQACCVRSRYQGDNLTVLGNKCLAFGGGDFTAGLGIYLTHAIGSETNVISGNEFAGVLLSERDFSKNHWAAPVGLIGQGSFDAEPVECADVIRDNTLLTNDFAFALSHTDGGCNQDVHCRSVEFSDGRSIIERFAILADGWRDGAGQEIAAELRSLNVSEPSQRTWVYAGRWQGSRARITVDESIGNAEEMLKVSGRFGLDVTLNGREVLP